jgi:hypothetical protein
MPDHVWTFEELVELIDRGGKAPMTQSNWPLSRCIVSSVLFSFAAIGLSSWTLVQIAANKYGDYRNLHGEMSPSYELISPIAGFLGFVLPWVLRTLERRREFRNENAGPPD